MTGWFLRKLFGGRKKRRFSAWQIELTTRCPLRCKMCIRDAATQSHTRDMNIDDFMKVVPYLRDMETAVLGGWGEPLLCRDLTRVVRLVKEARCAGGFVAGGWMTFHTALQKLYCSAQVSDLHPRASFPHASGGNPVEKPGCQLPLESPGTCFAGMTGGYPAPDMCGPAVRK
jgi:hypothetical protein